MDKTDIELANEIMGAVEQSDAWFEAYNTDPAIQKDWKHFTSLLAELPDDTAIHIEEAYSRLESDVISLAILYGMRAMWTMHEAMKAPAVMSQFLLDRMEGRA